MNSEQMTQEAEMKKALLKDTKQFFKAANDINFQDKQSAFCFTKSWYSRDIDADI